jgi:hypothetical protein
MEYREIVFEISDILYKFDSEMPIHKAFKAGIGPFGEPQIVKEIADRLGKNHPGVRTKRKPDMEIGNEWAIEFKIVRP